MNASQFGGLIRNLLIPAAAFMAAHGIATGTWDGIVGFIVAGVTFGWAAWQHDATQDMLLSLVRSAIGAGGGYALQKGWASSDQVTIWTSAVAIVVPNIWTWFTHADPAAVSSIKKASAIALLAALLSLGALVGLGSPPAFAGDDAVLRFVGVTLPWTLIFSMIALAATILLAFLVVEAWPWIKRLARLAALGGAVAGALGLGACSTVQNAWNLVSNAALTPTQVIVAGNSFDAAEATATNYLKLPTCVSGGPTICKTQAAVAAIVPAVRSGRTARNALESACTSSTAATGCVSAYQTVSTAVSTLQSLFTQYNVKGS